MHLKQKEVTPNNAPALEPIVNTGVEIKGLLV